MIIGSKVRYHREMKQARDRLLKEATNGDAKED
jgi:hypothetical protein